MFVIKLRIYVQYTTHFIRPLLLGEHDLPERALAQHLYEVEVLEGHLPLHAALGTLTVTYGRDRLPHGRYHRSNHSTMELGPSNRIFAKHVEKMSVCENVY